MALLEDKTPTFSRALLAQASQDHQKPAHHGSAMKTATASTPCKPAGTKAELKDCFPPLKATQKRCSEPNCN